MKVSPILQAAAAVLSMIPFVGPKPASAAPGDLVASFDAGLSSAPNTVALQPDGKIVVGGSHSDVRFQKPDQLLRPHLARINPDGTPDASFYPSPNDRVTCIAILDDGKILISGWFTSLQPGGNNPPTNPVFTRNYLARLHPNGTVDESFNASGTLVNEEVHCMVPLPDGRILLGGKFSQVNGQPRSRIAMINADGSLADGFTCSVGGSRVQTISRDSQGRFILGSEHLYTVNGITRYTLARIHPDGSLDEGFNPNPLSAGWIYSTAVLPDDSILVGGEFTTIGGGSARHFAKLDADGVIVGPGFVPPNPNDRVYGITPLTDGSVLISGSFSNLHPTGAPGPLNPAISRLARIQEDGTADLTFSPDPSSSAQTHVVISESGRLFLAGNFNTVNGQPRVGLAEVENGFTNSSLRVDENGRIEWIRSGALAEPTHVTFDLSTDGGDTWVPLGMATRILGSSGWELAGSDLPDSGKIRARARFTYGYQGSSSLAESVSDYVIPVVVSGEANLWLSGQPDGTSAYQMDTAPEQSPVLANITLVPGHDLVFQVFGGTHNGPGPGTTGPDGGSASSHSPENGIGPMTAPLNSLVGVFVNDDTPAQPAPSLLLDFSNPDNQSFPVLLPGLRQPFFIGDGLDADHNTQHFRVPEGATRLFLGSFDAFTNKENSGSFAVIIDQVDPIDLPTLPASTDFTIEPGPTEGSLTFIIEQTSLAAGLTLRVESTLDPNDPQSWTALPTGAAMVRDGDIWELIVDEPPVGNRYFRVVAVAPGYQSTSTVYQEDGVTVPILIEPPVLPLPAPVPLNLISWWPGENTPWDVAGAGQGSMRNAEDFDPYDVGKVGRAFWLDGIDDYIEGNDDVNLVGDFTIEVWVNPLIDTGEAMILSKRDPDGVEVSYAFFLRDGSPVFQSVTGGVTRELAVGGDPLPIDEWTHLAYTEDDQGERRIYVDGVLAASSPTGAARSTTSGPLTIGAFVDDTHPTETPGAPFDGLIDELSIYNRALSGTEITPIVNAGKSGKARHDPARDFSDTSNPSGNWRYGWIDGPGTPMPSNLTGGDPNLGGLFIPPATLGDTTFVYGTAPGSKLAFNRSKDTWAAFEDGDPMDPTNIDIAPRQFALHPSDAGDYSVLHWTAPDAGDYALSATFTGAEDSPTTTDVYLYRGNTELFGGMIGSFLGEGVSVTEEASLSAGDTVSWIVGGGATPGLDYTGLVASAVLLQPSQPFASPDLLEIDFQVPLMNGRPVTFRAMNPSKGTHNGMTAQIQYSATPGDVGSWVDLPGGVMTSSTPTSQTFVATVNNLPVGNFFAFRIATTVEGLGTTFSTPSDTFKILAAAPFLEIEQDVSSASDPTGDTTHRGDSLTYTARFRNSGGLPALPGDAVQVLMRVPDGTTVVAAGSTPGYETVVSGGVTFAKWTLNRQLNPFDAPQTFTVESVTSDLIRSANHGFEDGDEVRVESSDILPGGLSAGSVYRIVSSTSNTFRLSGPPPVNGVNILSTGSGTHTVRRVDSWQRRTLKLAVADPPISSESTVDDVDFGDTLTTFARITDRFHGLGGIADSETFATEVVSPLRLTAADPVVGVTQDPNAPGFEVRQGSFVTVDFTIRNEASYRMNETFVRVFAPDGLTILSGVFTSGSGNPTVSETPDGEQLLVFECGPLDPGAERVCQARFRVQYDFPFTEPQNSIDFLFATASTARPPLVVYDTKRYKKYYFKKNPRTGKKVRKFYWRTRKVPRNDARNGLERDLENPFQLIVGESPGIPKAILEVSEFSQSGLGSAANASDLFRDIPKEQRPHLQHVEMVADSTAPVPYSNPSRLSSELLLRVDFQNTGNARSEFNRIKLKIPATMTYVAGSASVRAPDGIINPTPTIQNGYYVFTVPFLDPGDTNNLTFKVKLKPGTPVGSFVFHESPTILSRDLRQNFPPLRPGLLAYSVAPGVMDYTRSIIPHFITDQDNKIIGVNKWEYQMDYFSRGGIAANGVGIRYYIPPGERFQEAYFSDFSGTKLTALQSRVVAPAANSPSGTVIFNVGQVVSKASGRVVVVTVPDSPNLPDRDIYGEQSDSAWETYDSSTGPPTGRREITVPKASVLIDAPTRHFTPLHADPFLVIEGRIAAHIGDQITYQIAMGNSGTNDVDQGFLAVPIPEGARFVSYQPVGNDHGNADVHNLLAPNTGYGFNDGRDRNYLFSDLDNLHGCLIVPVSIGINGSVVVKVTLEMTGNEQSFVVLQPKLILETRTLAGAAFQTFRPKASDPLNVQLSAVYSKFMGTAAAASLGTADQPNNLFLGHRGNLSLESRSVSVIGADFLQTTDGHVIVQSGSKIVAAGGGNVVANDGAGLISNGAAVVANDGAGFMMTGDSDKVTLRIPGFGRATAQFALNNIVNIVAGGGGNIVAAGGGNLVRPVALVGSQNVMIAASLIGQDGAGFATYLQFGDGSRKFVLADASEVLLPSLTSNSLMASAGLIGQDGAGLVGQDGAGLIGKGGAGIVAGGGGNMLFADQSNFVPKYAIVAAGGGNIVAGGGGNIVAAGGGNIVAAGGGNFVRGLTGIVAAGGGN